MKLINCDTGEVISSRVMLADKVYSRLIGLMGKKGLPADSALILKPCFQIHTFFMRFNIDVIFLSRDMHVIHVIENMLPWKISKFIRDSYYVVELPGGTLKGTVYVGHRLHA